MMIQRLYVVPLLMMLGCLTGCGTKKEALPKHTPSRHSERAQKRRKDTINRRAAESKPTLGKMGYDELKTRVAQLQATGNTHIELKYLERLIPLADDNNEKERLILRAATLYFEEGEYEKAEAKYQLYETLFPSGKSIQMAAYSKILCAYYSTLSADRDQSLTRRTLDYAREFLAVPSFLAYRSEVENIVHDCYQKLFDHERDIIEQKLIKGTPESMRAAQMRLAHIKNELVNVHPALKAEYASLEDTYQAYAASLQGGQYPYTDIIEDRQAQLVHNMTTEPMKPLLPSSSARALTEMTEEQRESRFMRSKRKAASMASEVS